MSGYPPRHGRQSVPGREGDRHAKSGIFITGRVVPVAAVESIGTGPALDDVVAAEAVDRIGTVGAFEDVVSCLFR